MDAQAPETDSRADRPDTHPRERNTVRTVQKVLFTILLIPAAVCFVSLLLFLGTVLYGHFAGGIEQSALAETIFKFSFPTLVISGGLLFPSLVGMAFLLGASYIYELFRNKNEAS